MSKATVQKGMLGTKFLAFMTIFSALLAVLSSISVPMPPPLWSISLFTLGISVVATLFGPKMGFLAGGIGGAIAQIYSAYGTLSGSDTVIFVVSAFVAKGVAGLVIGYGSFATRPLAKRQIKALAGIIALVEALFMTLGRTVELTIFFLIDTVLYGVAAASIDYLGMVTLITIPIALAVNEGVRRAFGWRYFDV